MLAGYYISSGKKKIDTQADSYEIIFLVQRTANQ